MNRVADGLYISDIQQAGDPGRYERHGIDAVIKLTHADPSDQTGGEYPADVTVHEYAMRDGPGNDPATMTDAVAATVARLETGDTVLVHCSAGASRSPAVAAAALAVRTGQPFAAALETVGGVRTIHVHDAVRANAAAAVEDVRHSG